MNDDRRVPRGFSRSVIMIKSCFFQRLSLAIISALISISLFSISICFFPLKSSNLTQSSAQLSTQLSTQPLVTPYDIKKFKPHHQNQTKKMSLRKKIFISMSGENSQHFQQAAVAWIFDFLNHPSYGGFHFIAPFSMQTGKIPLIVFPRNPTKGISLVEFYQQIYQSILHFNNNSRALWYLYTPINTYLNVASFPSFFDFLNSNINPLQSKNAFISCGVGQTGCVLLIPRGLTNDIISTEYNLNYSNKTFFEYIQPKIQPLKIPIISGMLGLSTAQQLMNGLVSPTIKCDTNSSKINSIPIWLLDLTKKFRLLSKLKPIKNVGSNIGIMMVDNYTIEICSF